MNRIRSLPASNASTTRAEEAAYQAEFGAAVASVRGGETPSTLFGPIHYEPNYRYPLVVWLHGDGASERQLLKVMPLVSLRNYVAVAPRGTVSVAPRRTAAGDDAGPTRTAAAPREPAAPRSYCWSQRSVELALAEHRVFDAVEQARTRYHLSDERVFLAGSGGGGTVALRLALMHPGRFAGVLSLGGRFPRGRAPLARIVECRRLPIFLGYGRDDELFGEDEIAEHLRLFHAAGMCVSLRQYPGSERLSPQMLADMDRWMMNIVTGSGEVF